MKQPLVLAVFCIATLYSYSQQSSSDQANDLQIRGNFQVLAQTYSEDTLINAQVPDEEMTLNSFANILATKGKFQAGIRYESYLPQQLGYSEPSRFKGSGIGYRFASYTDDDLSITVGNFYEQFGRGLTLRSFEDRNLGLENAMDGVKVTVQPIKGLYVKGVFGKMRLDFNDGIINSEGFTRGIDGELNINELDSALSTKKTKVSIGGSFVSKYQKGNASGAVLPENVGTYAGRINLIRGNWTFGAEYAEKINDPSADNSAGIPNDFGRPIYNRGTAIQGNLSYSQKGFAVSLDSKFIDNFSYRPDRNLQGLTPMINFHPALSRQHSSMLASQFYAYATQPTGEFAYMAELSYKFKKETLLGGKYGTQLKVNYARATGIETTPSDSLTFATSGIAYETSMFKSSGNVFFSDLNVEIRKKISKKLKTKFTYYNFVYNNTVNQGAVYLSGLQVKGTVYADVFVFEANVKTRSKQNLRIAAQMLNTKQHQQDWAALVLEYTISPHWNFALVDTYNYGNNGKHKVKVSEEETLEFEEEKIHYPLASIAYSKDAHRISFEYGKRRAGLFCVGGVCRTVPASNGLTVTLTSSF